MVCHNAGIWALPTSIPPQGSSEQGTNANNAHKYTIITHISPTPSLPPSPCSLHHTLPLSPRVPVTQRSLRVLSHFQTFLATKLPDGKTSTQNSTATTPTSNGAEIPFVNFYATRDPPWAGEGNVGRLVLVA